jgi:tetratricopeptide (TPR) repeat protein
MIGQQTVGRARVAMSDMVMNRSEELRQEALALVRAGDFEKALDVYDSALAETDDEEFRELITINKADTLVALERGGPEVQALPAILMRRRSPRSTFWAAYALLYKCRIAGETKRAMFYGQIALETAADAQETFWRIAALNELGTVYDMDSQFPRAIECFEQAIAIIDDLENPTEYKLSYGLALENLGSSKLLAGDTVGGIACIEKAVASLMSPMAIAEAYIDLCYGYLDLEEYEKARRFGEEGLALASDPRQVRNAHYLLGEAAYKMHDIEAAELHFEELARYYPQFRNLKTLLFAFDLRSMINLKL